jgi:hypothetical protein
MPTAVYLIFMGSGQRAEGRGQRTQGREQRIDGTGHMAQRTRQRAEGRDQTDREQRSAGRIKDWKKS